MKHTIIFNRIEGLGGVTTSAVCTFESEEKDGFYALQKAVTRWINETPNGMEAYKESSEDFNIGDLANQIGINYQWKNLLFRYGVEELDIQISDISESFDRHLYLGESL
jgi:hypothetical protein